VRMGFLFRLSIVDFDFDEDLLRHLRFASSISTDAPILKLTTRRNRRQGHDIEGLSGHFCLNGTQLNRFRYRDRISDPFRSPIGLLRVLDWAYERRSFRYP